MTNAQHILVSAPNKWFAKAQAAGCTFFYDLDSSEPPRTLVVEARMGETRVGLADFTEPLSFGNGAGDPYCNNVTVVTGHHHQGIANSMYILAEQILGGTLQDFWAGTETQSAAAAGLWAQSDRPFG